MILRELYICDQFLLGFSNDKPVIYRAGIALFCIIAYKQPKQLDRVVFCIESGAFRTDRTFKVRNTEGEK